MGGGVEVSSVLGSDDGSVEGSEPGDEGGMVWFIEPRFLLLYYSGWFGFQSRPAGQQVQSYSVQGKAMEESSSQKLIALIGQMNGI